MGYYFYFPSGKKIVVARYTEFLENNLISQEASGRAVEFEEIQDEDTSPFKNTSEIHVQVEGFEPPQEEISPIRRSVRTHRALERLCLNVEVEEHKIQSMKDNQVWRMVDLPPNDSKAIRILIAIAAIDDYAIWQMDVKTTFLNSHLDDDIYMVQPGGFIDPKHPRNVCKLQRSIYGLKHALRSWNKRFDEEIKKFVFAQDLDEPCDPLCTVRCTRPDVASAQNITSRLDPGEPHWIAVKNILKYLRNTKDMFLVYGGNPEAELRVTCYCDVEFETDRDDIKSQTRYVFVLNGGAVDWKSSKQSTTAMSAIEAEYIVASKAAMEAVWIREFISGLGIVPTINKPIKMLCDNSAALLIANEPGVQRGARNYHRRYHYVRECIESGEINLLKVHTNNYLADPFTKALPKGKLTQHARSIGLRLASSFM
ncbi:zinc finger, CCHC-type containing protein [Tanacetum coccineum]